MASRQTLQRPIEVEHDGKRHRGYYTVSGVRELRIFVHSPGRTRPHTDAFVYAPDTKARALKAHAVQLLWEIVTGRADPGSPQAAADRARDAEARAYARRSANGELTPAEIKVEREQEAVWWTENGALFRPPRTSRRKPQTGKRKR